MGNKKTVIIKLLMVLFVSVMICVLNTDLCNRWLGMMVCSPESYYHDVAGRELKAWTASTEKMYSFLQKRLAGTGKARKVTCKVELGDTLKALTGNLGLDSASLIAEGERIGEEVAQQMTLQINEKDALHVNGYLHYGERHGFVQVPEISEARLTFLSNDWDKDSPGEQYLFFLMGNAEKYLPQAEELSVLSSKYRYLLLNQDVDVTRSREQIQANGISQKCTSLTASYSGESCYQIMQELLKYLEEDCQTLAADRKVDLEESAPERSWEEERDIRIYGTQEMTLEKQLEMVDIGYQAARDYIGRRQKELVDHQEQFLDKQSGLTVQIWVDSMGNIVGRSITINMGGKTVSVRQLLLRNGKNFGCEISVSMDDVTYVQLSGKVSVHGGKLSGNMDISLDPSLNPDPARIQSTDSLVKVSVRELDLSALIRQQELRGELEISTEQIPAWKYYRLQTSLDHGGDQSNDRIQIMAGNNVFATISLLLEDGEHPDIGKRKNYDGKKNSYRLSDLGELADYASEVDLEQVLRKIEKNCEVQVYSLP